MIHIENTKQYLTSNLWPIGLQKTLINSLHKFPIRYFIVDDSGSMNMSDGHRLIHNNNNYKKVNSTRWNELVDCIKFHSGLAEASKTPIEFRFLNELNPIMVGVDDTGYKKLITLLNNKSPNGSTPICKQIDHVVKEITLIAPQLISQGHKAVITILTDGESTDGDISLAMKPLEQLPVWVVVRVCTDDDNIVNYWNNIDNQLELDMDVLDDLWGESIEIFNHQNDFVTYAEPLHRLREFGCPIKEMDLIDECTLNADQMIAIVAAM